MSDSAGSFISEEISVTRDERQGHPVSFRWKGIEYSVGEVIACWQDWGFAGGAPARKTWRMRRHRNYYRVETTDGAVFELYHDRGIKITGGKWYLHSRLS